jgi:hypothetical protein
MSTDTMAGGRDDGDSICRECDYETDSGIGLSDPCKAHGVLVLYRVRGLLTVLLQWRNPGVALSAGHAAPLLLLLTEDPYSSIAAAGFNVNVLLTSSFADVPAAAAHSILASCSHATLRVTCSRLSNGDVQQGRVPQRPYKHNPHSNILLQRSPTLQQAVKA